MAGDRLRAFRRALTDSHTELAIHVAVATLILVLGDVVMMAVVSRVAPALHAHAATIPEATRRWFVGVPSALVYLAIAARRLWRATSGI